MKLKAFLLILLCVVFAAPDLDAEAMKKKRRKKKRRKKGKVVAFKQGQIGIAAYGGFGVKTDYAKSDYSLYGTNEIKKGFPLGFRAEYGVTDFLGIGLGFGMYKEELTITDVTNETNVFGFDHSFKMISIRPAFHIPLGMAKLDPYAAVSVGPVLVKAKATGDNNFVQEPLKNGFLFGAHAGANYYFTENIGAFAEVGYGKWVPLVNFGLAVKF
jgi:opacity protein-like surface antigen